MKNTRTELSQRVQYALLAGMAGAFLIPQVAFAAPTGGEAVFGGATGLTTSSDMNITSSNLNNVITWRDYSIAQGERVRYDSGNKTNNYLNIVTGANTSNINGMIEGGKNVYIVNPNGVIFGKSAEVNVGNLYVSTQAVSTVNKDADMENNVSPLDTSAGLSDVVNMGEITANTVEVHGKNIRFLNAANVHTTASPVVLHTDTANGGYAHIGYESGHAPAAADYQVNGAAATAADNYYQLVANESDLNAINTNTTNLAGNYMLANDIDYVGAAHTPIGNHTTPFKGKFDGNFFQIRDMTVSGTDDAGFFGALENAHVYNLGIVGGSVASNTGSGNKYAGGIAGSSTGDKEIDYSKPSHPDKPTSETTVGTKLYNVYVKGTKVSGNDYYNGGLIGQASYTTIDGAYSTAKVGAHGGGIVGRTPANMDILNTYNDATVTGSDTKALFIQRANKATVTNSYTHSDKISSYDNTVRPHLKNVFYYDKAKKAWYRFGLTTDSDVKQDQPYAKDTYTGWDINNDGAPGAKWRIYEGRTLPLLTAFMNGRVDSVGSVGVEYKYRKFNQADGNAVDDPANAVKSNNRADITNLTYDSKIIKITDSAGNVITTSKNINYDKSLTDAQKNTVKMYTDTGTSLSKTDNIRNAGTKAILWSDQDGPNLRNVNVTIGKRKIDVKGGSFSVEREYNGSADVTNEFKEKFKAGGISANGFVDGDSVTLAYTNFKATMQAEGTIRAKDANDNAGDPLKKVKFEGEITVSGDDADNYDTSGLDFGAGFVGTNGLAKITKAKLTLNVVKDSATKIYDGTDTVTQSGMDAATNLKLKNEDIKTDDTTNNPDDVSLNADAIAGPTYIKANGTPEIHAGEHKIRYKNVTLAGADSRNYKLVPSSTTATLTGTNLDLQGTITRRRITTNDFKVYEKGRNEAVEATKTYDGSSEYTPDSTKYYLSSNQASNTEDTGVVTRDRGYITFALTRKANFNTKDVRTADKITYNVRAQADKTHTDDVYHEKHLLSDYWVLNNADNPLTETTAFDASGKGKITPRVLTATVVNNRIEKVYDGTKDHTQKGKDIVKIEGFVGDDTRENTSTVTYTNENVVSDTLGSQEKEQDVNYTASFERATGDESDNYTLDPTGKNVVSSVTPTGSYKGIIKRRALTLEMDGVVQKVYDGTAANKKSGITAIDNVAERDKATVTADTLKNKHRDMLTAGTATSSYGRGTDSSFTKDANASNGNTHNVRYENMDKVFGTAFDALKNNYTMDSTVYGAGEITRRRINPDGFQVLRKQSDGTYQAESISKTYDGTSTYTLPDGAYLRTPTVTPTPSDKTGIIEQDKDKIRFRLASNTHGTFQDEHGTETTHVSEAKKVAYKVVAYGVEGTAETDAPLRNYTFGTVAEETGGTLKNLENLKEGKTPAAVTADGSITPAKIQATTHAVEKVYDGTAEHRDKNREIVMGDAVVTFTGWTSDSDKRTNASTATYADKNVARNAGGGVIEKNVTYKAQLTGQYADDYEITGITAGAGTALAGGTATTLTVANAGKITPRQLNITMKNVEKTYNRSADNPDATVTKIEANEGQSFMSAVLSNEGVTADTLTTKYQSRLNADPTMSTYGKRNGTKFTSDFNASAAPDGHAVRYTKMDEVFKGAFGAAAGNYTVDATVYGTGTIKRKAIDNTTFNISGAPATKVYDGTSRYDNVSSGLTLTPKTGEIVNGDVIQFAIDRTKGATFMKTDGTTPTANVADAKRVSYNITATGDAQTLRNYTLNGKTLDEDGLTASGEGKITRRVLSLGLVQDEKIDKVYDGSYRLVDKEKNWNKLKDEDAKGNVVYTGTNKLVNDGTSLTITSEYRNDANTEHDKNVRGTSASPQVKDILYNISITGGDANNYSFDGGTSSAAGGLKLSAKGTITPKDISNAFKPMTKVYDGGTTVDRNKVELASGTFIGNDSARVKNTYQAEFESPNVNGNSEGKNWVNYTHLELDGTDANNYTIASATTGKGNITPYILDSNSVKFKTREASKVYDGTTDVKWTNGSSELNDVKNYITGATVDLTPAGGGATTTKSVLEALNLTEKPQYDKKDVDGGRKTDRVTYTLSYDRTKNPNFSLKTGGTSFTTKGDGIITKKDVTATVNSPLTKTYDATRDVLAGAGDNITLTGLVAGDGTKYETTATYADKNAGDNKRIDYTLNFIANGGNYNLKYNGADNAGAFSTNNNTITKRKVDVTFDHVSKDYDSKETNTKIAPKVSAADAAVLQQDSAGNVSGTNITNLTGVTSAYGTLSGGTFTPDANAGDKTVRYQGVGTAMGTVFGTNNYDFNVKDGTGRINRAKINAGNVVFDADDAHKTYDGTTTVKYGGSSANSEVRKYINRIGVTLNGNWINLQNDVTMDSAEYSDVNATNGTKHRVTYKFHLNNSNIDISGDNTFSKDKEGIIDRRVLNLDLAQKSGIDKIYDATSDVHNTNTRHYNAFVEHDALGNVTYAAGTTEDTKLVRKADGTPDATVNVEAAYADKNVARVGGNVTAQNITYTARIAGDAGKNYTLQYGTTKRDADVGIDLSATGTITPRKLTLDFADVQKPYDTKEDNANKTVRDIGGDDDGRRAATLAADGITKTTFNMTNVGSFYGAGNTDATFHKDPNVVTDANGNVVENGKDVQYKNLAGTLAGQSYAGNYEIVNTAYGKGTIRKRVVTANDFKFNINNATKTYDGTKDVYWKDTVTGKSYKDMDHVKNYFSTSKLDLGGGNLVDINLNDIQLNSAQYNHKNAVRPNGITYNVTINTKNFEFSGTRTRDIDHTGDTITKRDLATMLPKHLIKEYDGKQTFDETNRDYVNALANENITHIVKADEGKIQLKVKGTYSDKNASAETKAEAEARTPATAQRTVDYKLTLSGDADTLANYTLAGHDTTHTVTGRAADIYKKTLTVTAKNIDKVYDGTRTVVRDAGGGVFAPHPDKDKIELSGFVSDAEKFSFDQTAADKIDGAYSDENVRRENGTVLDKDISYSGVKAAFKNYADNHAGGAAKNYRVDSDTMAGRGKIMPRTITADQLTEKLKFDTATKTYDGTTTVKHGAGALENYISSAKVDIGGREIDIKKDLKIRSDKDWTHYDTEHVDGGRKTNRVTYTLDYTGNNFDITGTLTKQADGVITKRKVTAYAPGRLTKMYDGTDKVLDADKSIKTYYRGKLVEKPDHIVQMEKAEESLDGDTGLLSTDGAKNESTAKFDDKNVGTNKTVTYDVKIDAAHNGDYEIVDVHGNAVTQLKTKNNEITKRKLNLAFDHVDKFYDASAENPDVTARVLDSDTRKTLQRDHAGFNGTQLVFEDSASNPLATPSYYGTGTTDSSFTQDANAGDKSVQYEVGDALRSLLGDDAKNYEFTDKGYGTGEIKKANVSEDDFRDLKFKNADKEYDGNANVNRPLENLRDDSRWKSNKMLASDIASIKGTYLGPDGKPDKNASEHNKDVAYQIQLSDRNFDFGNWNGQVTVKGAGRISRRELTADYLPKQTKVYDGTKNIASVGDDLVTFRHKSGASAFIDGDKVRNRSTATYDDANVAWKNDVWKQGSGQESDKDVNYDLKLSGEDAANYKIVDGSGTEIHTLKGKNNGKIMAKEIHLKADSQTRWINEGLPDSYSGTPMGSNLGRKDVPELVPGEVLPGQIEYSSPNARLRWGDYAINGTYRAPNAGTRYQLPDGTWTTQSFAGGDGDAVSRNYRFVQDTANATAFHMGPYVPDNQYYKALTQTSKMLPDEYAYEHAALDYRSHFGRDAETEIATAPPSINVIYDGTDVTRAGIHVTDDTVYTIVNEVFGA
ncbi:YDG domain-containing protein [Selenomonas dianae]|uniref:Filamentous haemagglutinin FhaB/tRNA nuclease CdiA-like TPS domain-containing protein n=1 Tax=Selenomonas dianae TaxID=135079 RepID=A0ABN0T2C4_9FIRM|nr:YDG domain-containing protein [Selenomonas dianae]WLD81981.1 YDG domain-containing protein [Selenomonas dianae]